MGFTVQGRTVLVTGAGRGMGRLYAERAAREGAAAVVLWDVDARALEDTVAVLGPTGTAVHSYVVDVGSGGSIRAAADAVLNDVGVPDVLVNNAGIVRGKYFWEHEHDADIDLTLRINTAGPMHVARAFLPPMIARGTPGRILNVASASGTLAVPRMSVYAASKWAVIGWSDSLRLELRAARHPIAVTTLIPSYIRTGMFEGARGPLLTPLMEPGYVVGRAWEGMLAGRARVQLPWTVQLAGTLRNLLPQPAWDVVAGRVFRVYSSMDHFTGRPDGATPDPKGER
ncbi:SDR family NAD(P)-dependent oxidoreductase [Arthrobacter agilis]|uniref:SDR family NAD(P)-dependent oxidoreductase n=1 Tax=Arthrobacter agilis TaxID=37921 RepID=UPI002366F305|nr:SDR family NAD(P)-dependent oxidoreductase [Arthrobacter agilis]WDF33437.1 SDR family NAD(P)-dependent oxidoreductase [Arthrobacter agilis]